ncbi:MAG TPA: coproporphyrinogen III oxidase family protein, partial [Geobacteraceae bacterium]|nr:coproporphyrinogen III oxidase family protein [Geobacteraceae bacterium]
SCAVIPEEDMTTLAERDAMSEFFFLGLRLREGVEEAQFCRDFGRTVEEAYREELAELLAEGLIEREAGFLRLSERGLLLANRVFMRFV